MLGLRAATFARNMATERSPRRRRSVGAGIAALVFCMPALAAPDYWDPRLNQICGLFLDDVASKVPPGQGYWRLVRGEFENEQQSGGNHHIFFKCLDGNGNPIENQKVWTSWAYTSETGATSQFTKGPLDQYWANFPMYVGTCAGIEMCGPASPGPWAYNAYVDSTGSPRGYAGPSDKVLGMGMTSPQGTPCGAHVNFRLTWRWTTAAPADPSIELAPASFTRQVSQGLNLSPDAFTLRNAGGGTLNYTIGDDADWLTTAPVGGGVGSGATHTVNIYYATAGLPLGAHRATITITAPQAANSPRTVAVDLTVRPPLYLGDFDGDADVDQQDFGFLQACFTPPGVAASPGCADARLDGDIDVDVEDVLLFEVCMKGPGQSPPTSCIR